MNEEKARQKFMEMQMLSEQLKQIHAQLEVIETKKEELAQSIDNIGSIKSMKQGSNLLTPLADGIFLKATLANTQNVLVNVGAGVVVEKTLEEAQRLLAEKQNELAQYETDLNSELQKLQQYGKNLEKELEELIK